LISYPARLSTAFRGSPDAVAIRRGVNYPNRMAAERDSSGGRDWSTQSVST